MNTLLAASIPIKPNFSPADRFANAGELFSDIIQIFIIISAVGAIFFIIMGGIKMITAAGDPKKLAAARNSIFYALVGLVVIALAFAIVQVVQYILRSQIPIT